MSLAAPTPQMEGRSVSVRTTMHCRRRQTSPRDKLLPRDAECVHDDTRGLWNPRQSRAVRLMMTWQAALRRARIRPRAMSLQ